MSQVVAKFRVREIRNRESYGEGECNAEVVMECVYDDKDLDSENARFTKATPSGSCEMQITNPAAMEQFQPGDEFYAYFKKAPEPA